jgi:hypothetical protein
MGIDPFGGPLAQIGLYLAQLARSDISYVGTCLPWVLCHPGPVPLIPPAVPLRFDYFLKVHLVLDGLLRNVTCPAVGPGYPFDTAKLIPPWWRD